MKRLILFLLFAAILVSCSTNNNSPFTINGTVKGIDSAKVVLIKFGGENGYTRIRTDSTIVKDGKFTFTGKTGEPEQVLLSFGYRQGIYLFLEPGAITVSADIDSLRDAVITGSNSQDILNKCNDRLKPFSEEQDKLIAEYRKAAQKNDEKTIKKIIEKWNALDEKRNEEVKNIITDNKDNVIGAFLVRSYFGATSPLEELEPLFNQLDPSLQNCKYYKILSKRINILKNVQIGKPAPDFTQNDADGNPFTLSSLKGKYVLIDFWASWCGPCIREAPNVVKVYKKFHDKGFDIIGVSFDNKREPWLKAIKDYNLSWHHVTELNGFNNSAGRLYGVNAIPHTVLIDKDGIIIAKNLRGEDLQKKLEEIFK